MIIEKMHGCGNDFCVLSYQEGLDYSKLALKLCNRKTGVGSDGMVVVKQRPLEMIFYNSDGSKAPMCGNGIRCFARYVYEHNLSKKKSFDVVTGAGKMVIEITQTEPFMCKVNMGEPIFNNSMLHITDSIDSFGRVLELKDRMVPIYSLFMGTIHTVIFVPDFESEILVHAEEICKHRLFTRHTNVNFAQIIDKENIKVKTYERGVGWTLACGTGCCAAVVAANKLELVNSKVNVELELGHLIIELTKHSVFMNGPATKVFECEFKEEI